MVSTRQMTNVVGGIASNTNPPPNQDTDTSHHQETTTTTHHNTRPQRHNSVITMVPSSASLQQSSTGRTTSTTTAAAAYIPVRSIALLDLPQEILEKILVYCGYKKIAQMRSICRAMNAVCSSILNSTFSRLQTRMLARFQAIKAKMPRRESARRNHPLACESDIVETLHMRLTLLQMTFGKHVERKHCCFFPGEILDEVYRILHYIRVTQKLARPYKVTDELFDLSTMAMEYFKEHIEPALPEIAYFGTDFLDFTGTFSGKVGKSPSYLCLEDGINTSSSSSTNQRQRHGSGAISDSSPRSDNETAASSKLLLSSSASGSPSSSPRTTSSTATGATSGGHLHHHSHSHALHNHPIGHLNHGAGGCHGGNNNAAAATAALAAAAFSDTSATAVASQPPVQSNMVLRKRIRKIKQGMKRYNSQLTALRGDLRACKRKTAEQQRQISEQQKQLAEQQKQTLEYAARLDENDKKSEETSRKFSTLLQELNKCKTELQYWRSKSPAATPVCGACGAPVGPLLPTADDMRALANQGVNLNPDEREDFTAPSAGDDGAGCALHADGDDDAAAAGAVVATRDKDAAVADKLDGFEAAAPSDAVDAKVQSPKAGGGNAAAAAAGAKRKYSETPTSSLAGGGSSPSHRTAAKKPRRGMKARKAVPGAGGANANTASGTGIADASGGSNNSTSSGQSTAAGCCVAAKLRK